MNKSSALVLMNEKRIERSLKRIAYQVVEDNRDNKEILVLGINDRGYAVADSLEAYLSDLAEGGVECHQILVGDENEVKGAASFSNKYVLLVDDVIFSGTTMFKALSTISGKEIPDEVHTATLIDRGHRKLPVYAQFTGMELPTKLNEHVDVIMKDHKPERVVLAQSMH